MIEQILQSIKLRPGISNFSDELLLDKINDAVTEIREYINAGDSDELSSFCITIVKELVILRCNKLGSEGLASQSVSGLSEVYTDDMPKEIKAKLRRCRKLR